MGKPCSDDLRERVVAAIEAGHTRVKVAELYNMALSFEHDGTLGAVGMTIRGEPAFGDPSQARRTGRNCQVSSATSVHCARAQYDAVRHHALPHEPPQGDQKLARQGHDHGFARAAGGLTVRSKPVRQGALLLKHETSPRQLDHAPPNSSVAGTGQPFFLSAFCATLAGRAREAGITRYGRRSRMFRASTSCTSMSAVSMPTPITRANRRTMACGPLLGACSMRSRRAFPRSGGSDH
jgi:hypothetical protein